MKLSVIIPALNEAANISNTLLPLQYLRQSGHEIILVDGGSTDSTENLARPYVDQIVNEKPGRARQMNSGARIATGNILIFLHADSILPENLDDIMLRISENIIWGRFDIRLSGNQIVFRVIERLINLRSRLSRIATGDQAIFMSKETYNKIGGFPEIILMEDIAICKKLRMLSSPVCISEKVITSSRRWEERGIFKTILLMWMLRLKYAMGIDVEKLAKQYD